MESDRHQKLDALARAVLQAEVDDLQGLALLHQQFEQLSQDVNADAAALDATQRAMDLLQGIILDEASDAAAALDHVVQLTRRLSDPGTAEGLSATRCYQIPAGADRTIVENFLARQEGVLEELEHLCLANERGADEQSMAQLRRIVHTLKGEAGLLAMDDVQRICHVMESALERTGGRGLGDALLQTKDYLSAYFRSCATGDPLPLLNVGLLSVFEQDPAAAKAREAASHAPELAVEHAPTGKLSDPELVSDFVAEAREHLDLADEQMLQLEADPTRDEVLAGIFRGFHTIKGAAGFLNFTQVKQVAHESESLLDAARRGDLTLTGRTLEACFQAIDVLRHLLDHVADAAQQGDFPDHSDRVEPLLALIREVQPATGSAPEKPKVTATPPTPLLSSEPSGSLVEPEIAAAERSGSAGRGVREMIKIDAQRLDALLDAIGELVIAESMVHRSVQMTQQAGSNTSRHLSQLSKITRGLQEQAMSLRMVPLKSTFQKMARLARDLSKKLDKPVDFCVVGGDTELDKSVVDQIGDPLIHLVRNAVDHGLESREKRAAAGKPEMGRLELKAFHLGGEVVIEIIDDGGGIDCERVLAKSRERGLVGPDDVLTHDQILRLVFQPGFSTAAQVTEVSGRGVGLDVVVQNIEALRGRVEIESEAGKGTVFRLRLPLTLAIIDGIIVRVGVQRFVLPTLSIVRIVRPEAEHLRTVLERDEMLSTPQGIVPLIRLDEMLLGARGQTGTTDAVVMVIESGARQMGLLVDELLEQQQVVIKPLSGALAGAAALSGGAIMADGRVGLVIDAAGLVRTELADRKGLTKAA